MEISLSALLLCLAVVVAVLATTAFGKVRKSNYATTEPYDAAYASIYDALQYDRAKNEFELTLVQIPQQAYALDVGCGLGHHVSALPCPAVGLDLAPAMVKAASTRYPEQTFVVGDALHKSTFSSETFTHMLCLNHTIYYVQRKDRLLHNMFYWLQSGGILALHLSDSLSFGPVREARTPFRYTATLTDSVYRERVTMNGVVRRYEHRFYFETVETILGIAMRCGFILYSMAKYNAPFEGQYLYLLQKP
jgi:ubiquinone/menaquinone biosynthesis C-methylase UbiE